MGCEPYLDPFWAQYGYGKDVERLVDEENERELKGEKRMNELKPCPFCGGGVSVATVTDKNDKYLQWFVTRGKGENPCKCRIFMESEQFTRGGVNQKSTREELVDTWNRRAEPANEPLTTDDLRRRAEKAVAILQTVDWVGSEARGRIADAIGVLTGEET